MKWHVLYLLLLGCGSGPQADGAVHAACDAYVDCVAATLPGAMATVEADYGRNGLCWKTLAPSECTQTCLTALQSTRANDPDALACPSCFSDADCAGRHCDAGISACVDCTGDADCGGATPICDPATLSCVACVADTDCPNTTPHCGTLPETPNAPAACYACISGDQCDSRSCVNGSCCVPQSCSDLALASLPAGAVLCGAVQSVQCPGATIDCGGCARGSCSGGDTSANYCSLTGTSCVPATPGACLGDEFCAYDPVRAAYSCQVDTRGQSCEMFNGSSCDTTFFDCVVGANLSMGICEAYCSTDADCLPSEKCFPAGSFGVCGTTI